MNKVDIKKQGVLALLIMWGVGLLLAWGCVSQPAARIAPTPVPTLAKVEPTETATPEPVPTPSPIETPTLMPTRTPTPRPTETPTPKLLSTLPPGSRVVTGGDRWKGFRDAEVQVWTGLDWQTRAITEFNPVIDGAGKLLGFQEITTGEFFKVKDPRAQGEPLKALAPQAEWPTPTPISTPPPTPTAAPPPTPSPTLPRYPATFDGPACEWGSTDTPLFKLGCLDGEYQMLMKRASQVVNVFAGGIPFADFALSVDVRFPSPVYGDVALFFNANDKQDFYMFGLRSSLEAYSLSTNGGRTLVGWIRDANFASAVRTTGANRMKVERKGADIRLYLNDKLLTTVSDTTLIGPNMAVGVYTKGGREPNFDVRWDNFDVRPLSGAP